MTCAAVHAVPPSRVHCRLAVRSDRTLLLFTAHALGSGFDYA